MACCGQKGTVSQGPRCLNFPTLRASWLIPAGIACSLAGRQWRMSHRFHLSSVQVLCFAQYLVPASGMWHTWPCQRAWGHTENVSRSLFLANIPANKIYAKYLQKCHLCILKSRWSPTPASDLQLFTRLRFLACDLWYTTNTNAASTQTDSRGKKTCGETAAERDKFEF